MTIFSNDLLSLSRTTLEECKSAGKRLTTAESCTGGLIAAVLTEIAGSSDVVGRCFVTYSNEAKHQVLGVPLDLLQSKGAVSPEVAEAMVIGALAQSPARLGISVTGIAGPSGATPSKPIGLVYLGSLLRDGVPRIEKRIFPGGRSEVRRAALDLALAMLDEAARR